MKPKKKATKPKKGGKVRRGYCLQCGLYLGNYRGLCEGCAAYEEHTNIYGSR